MVTSYHKNVYDMIISKYVYDIHTYIHAFMHHICINLSISQLYQSYHVFMYMFRCAIILKTCKYFISLYFYTWLTYIFYVDDTCITNAI